MPTQIIRFPRRTFETLRSCEHGLAAALFDLNMGIEGRLSTMPPAEIVISAYHDSYGLGSRRLTTEDIPVLVLALEDREPDCWPLPLAAEVVLRLIDKLEHAVNNIDDMSAHARVEVVEVLDRARSATPIPRLPPAAKPPKARHQRRLRQLGLLHSTKLAHRFVELNDRVAAYRDRLAAADVDALVVALSCSAELGLRLQLQPHETSGRPVAALVSASRRGEVSDAFYCATALANTTLFALRQYDPHAARYLPDFRIGELALFHSYLTGRGPCGGRNADWRVDSDNGPNPSRSADRDTKVPAPSVRAALNRWCDDMSDGRWIGLHPLVHAAVAHNEFVRLQPFASGNGRLARIIMQIILRRAGWPALPWEAVLERNHDRYREAVLGDLREKARTELLQLLIDLCDEATVFGDRMIEVIRSSRDALMSHLAKEFLFAPLAAQTHAEALLRGVLTEGSLSNAGGRPTNEHLFSLLRAGLIDRIRTPIGAAYSVPAVRELMRRIMPSLGRRQI
jgi:hypothetical protein